MAELVTRDREVALGLLLFALDACAHPCSDPVDLAPDYTDAASWLCGSDVGSSLCAKAFPILDYRSDGSVVTTQSTILGQPEIDVFYVYPTMDLRLGSDVADLDDLEDVIGAVESQAAPFAAVARVYAPVYRQATLGSYLGNQAEDDVCIELAYSDVLAAFDRYLAHDNQGRGIVLLGHSQGSNHVAQLVRDRFDGKPLQDQLVVAMPLGWSLGTDAGSTLGGSFEHIPVCTASDETGCVVGFRSMLAGARMPLSSGSFKEGDRAVCTNPASPDDPAASGRLTGALFKVGRSLVLPDGVSADQQAWLRVGDLYTARCVQDDDAAALEITCSPAAGDVRTNPVDPGRGIVSGAIGSHIYDVAFTSGDLVADVARRSKVWLAR